MKRCHGEGWGGRVLSIDSYGEYIEGWMEECVIEEAIYLLG
jgi:hypothetical protein